MGQRWMITGASRGIGLAAARAAAARGHQVALVARGAAVADAAAALGDTALAVQADVTDASAVRTAAAEVAAKWGGIDVLVNNAGLHRGGRIQRLDSADWASVLATNLTGPFNMVQAVVDHMPEGGAIVNVGAVVGLRGFPGDAPYGASKAGLAGLTLVLATELARRQIRVNLVIPGLVPTEMTAGVSEAAREALIARIPLGRQGREDEIADVIYWVSQSTYMTGAVIPTDGGLMCAL